MNCWSPSIITSSDSCSKSSESFYFYFPCWCSCLPPSIFSFGNLSAYCPYFLQLKYLTYFSIWPSVPATIHFPSCVYHTPSCFSLLGFNRFFFLVSILCVAAWLSITSYALFKVLGYTSMSRENLSRMLINRSPYLLRYAFLNRSIPYILFFTIILAAALVIGYPLSSASLISWAVRPGSSNILDL